ncbi:MAG: glycosyltransferase [Armatimonadetes bacterium]|nr:glycosyltransferase [Armatimonadota bacterium]
MLEALCQGKFASHSNHWESAELVRQLIERGFVVDCIWGRDGSLVEDVSGYDLILDEWSNLPRWAAKNPQARRWFYGTTSFWLFCNAAELQRLNWLFERRGVVLPPQWQLPPLLGLHDADVVTYFGNDFSAKHFGLYQPKLRKLWVSTSASSPHFKPKDWTQARKRFLFYGSSGWVHRGLDLVLEAFLKTDLELLICMADQKFLEVYGEDLQGRKNIQYLGFVPPDSAAFQQIVQTTSAIVYPSAAEGCSTSVLQCMQFGLIPIVTESTGLSIHPDWPPLKGETDQHLIENILQRCIEISENSDSQLEELSHGFWEYANRNHTRLAYRESLRTVLDEFLG